MEGVFLVATIVYPRALFPTLVEYLEDRPRFLEAFRLSTLQLLGCQVVASTLSRRSLPR